MDAPPFPSRKIFSLPNFDKRKFIGTLQTRSRKVNFQGVMFTPRSAARPPPAKKARVVHRQTPGVVAAAKQPERERAKAPARKGEEKGIVLAGAFGKTRVQTPQHDTTRPLARTLTRHPREGSSPVDARTRAARENALALEGVRGLQFNCVLSRFASTFRSRSSPASPSFARVRMASRASKTTTRTA